MTNVKLSPLEREAESRRLSDYPSHGWAQSEAGSTILWLPIKGIFVRRWLRHNEAFLSGRTLRREPGLAFEAFNSTLGRLAVVLREVAPMRRELTAEAHKELKDWDQETAMKVSSVAEVMLPKLDLAFVYVRRLADRLTDAGRFLLFHHPRSAPRTFSKMITAMKDRKGLDSYEPLCDPAELRAVFMRLRKWFELLTRDDDVHGLKSNGLRHLLEHPVGIQASMGMVNGAPEMDIHLAHTGLETNARLCASLSEIMRDFCVFWTQLVPLMDDRSHYDHLCDSLQLSGDQEDVAAFWPRLMDDANAVQRSR